MFNDFSLIKTRHLAFSDYEIKLSAVAKRYESNTKPVNASVTN